MIKINKYKRDWILPFAITGHGTLVRQDFGALECSISCCILTRTLYQAVSRTFMMKFPVSSDGCNTRWSTTEPELLNVST